MSNTLHRLSIDLTNTHIWHLKSILEMQNFRTAEKYKLLSHIESHMETNDCDLQ